MAKRKKSVEIDENEIAAGIIEQVLSDQGEESPEKNPHAVALGHLGGKKGGPARAKKLTKKRRSEIAKKAAKARWANQDR